MWWWTSNSMLAFRELSTICGNTTQIGQVLVTKKETLIGRTDRRTSPVRLLVHVLISFSIAEDLPCSQERPSGPWTRAARCAGRFRAEQPQPRPVMAISIHLHLLCLQYVRTTVKSANGRASSMFFSVFCRSPNSLSTTVLVSSAL
jgi:hypothetical protein